MLQKALAFCTKLSSSVGPLPINSNFSR